MVWLVACNGPVDGKDISAEAPEVAHFGRGDPARPGRATPVALEVTGLGAWGDGDSLQLVSPDTGTTLAGLEANLAVSPGRGSTTITGQQLDWTKLQAPLIEAGDTTYVTQLIQHAGYASLGRAGIAAGFALRDGAPGKLAVQLAPVAEDRAIALRYQGRAFARLAAEAGPGARPAAMAQIAVHALPEPLAHHNDFAATLYQGLPALAVVGPQLAGDDAELAIAYGNPFATGGAAWTDVVTVVYPMTVPVTTASGASSLPARIVVAMPASALANADLAPAISPVRDVVINDLSLAVDQAGLGAAPTIAWRAPAVGHATDYAIEVRAVEAGALGVELPVVATLHTRATRIQLPASVAPGKPYVLTITAIAAPAGDTLPYASADFVTAQLSL